MIPIRKKIFITGSNGFIGRNLVEFLKDSYDLCLVPHKELELLNSDDVKNFFSNNTFDRVIHCATIGGSRKTGYDNGTVDVIGNNLRMFFNIVRSLQPETRMIHFGSGAEYNKKNPLHKISENAFGLSVPEDDYGFSKYVISQFINTQPNITCLRLFGVYGKYEDYTYKFISNAVMKNLLHLPIVINQNVVFDYLFIEDLTEIVSRFIERSPEYRHLNVTPGESVDLITIANLINEIGDFQSEIVVINPGMNREYTADNSRLLREIGEYNFKSYREGIKKLYEYYAENLTKLDVQTIKQDPYLKYCTTKK